MFNLYLGLHLQVLGTMLHRNGQLVGYLSWVKADTLSSVRVGYLYIYHYFFNNNKFVSKT